MQGEIDYTRLQIIPDADTREWWAGTENGKFMVRQCLDCGNKFFPPVPACRKCGALDVEGKLGWFETAKKGVIYSYIVVVQPILAHLVPAVPYVVATIELNDCTQPDGTVVRVPINMIADESEVAIGLPVDILFEPTNQDEFQAPRAMITGTAENIWRFPG